jgi:hypothetical protein
VASLVLVLTACTRSLTLSHSNDTAEQLSARVDAFHSRDPLRCNTDCRDTASVCQLAAELCQISEADRTREDWAKGCVSAQEECARFQNHCATCQLDRK